MTHVLDTADGFADAAEATARLSPKLGRARIHGDRSLGCRDAGAVLFALAAQAVGAAIARGQGSAGSP